MIISSRSVTSSRCSGSGSETHREPKSTSLSSATSPASDLARAVLVGVDFGRDPDFDDSLDELALLAQTAGDEAVARVVARRKAPDAALFVGSGKADEIKSLVLAHEAETAAAKAFMEQYG